MIPVEEAPKREKQIGDSAYTDSNQGEQGPPPGSPGFNPAAFYRGLRTAEEMRETFQTSMDQASMTGIKVSKFSE